MPKRHGIKPIAQPSPQKETFPILAKDPLKIEIELSPH